MITLHFVSAYCPLLNPIERLWSLMHKHLTHNKAYATYREFVEATRDFPRKKFPNSD
jgi:transposase